MIMGPTEQLLSVPLLPGEAPEGFGAKLSAALAGIAGQDTLVLIDLFGGTPYNVAARLVLSGNCECVTGANLPMLLEVLSAREDSSLEELAATAAQAGQDSVKNLGPMLRKSEIP
jgi:mannose/fructose/sorbose-specific phosphotransferase system IIA component